MSGFTYTSDAAAVSAHKHALLETIEAALAEDEGRIDIDFGIRWPPISDDSVSVTATRSDPEPVNVGSKRTHWVNISIDVEIYSTRSGVTGTEERLASDGAFDILRRIDEYIRNGDNITLGGAAQSCFLGATQSAGASEEDDMQRGWRGIGIVATFNTRAYITN